MSSTLYACCGQPFEPRPQVSGQACCSSPDCQRARKRQWQRAKLLSDSDYRINQRAAQQAWSQRNPDYWRDYRDARHEYVQRSREQQRLLDEGRFSSITEIAAAEEIDRAQASKIAQLARVAPEIVDACVAGTAGGVTLERMIRRTIPAAWDAQRIQFFSGG